MYFELQRTRAQWKSQTSTITRALRISKPIRKYSANQMSNQITANRANR